MQDYKNYLIKEEEKRKRFKEFEKEINLLKINAKTKAIKKVNKM
jgi:hypothetical protein